MGPGFRREALQNRLGDLFGQRDNGAVGRRLNRAGEIA
jgi:hypothetical protein